MSDETTKLNKVGDGMSSVGDKFASAGDKFDTAADIVNAGAGLAQTGDTNDPEALASGGGLDEVAGSVGSGLSGASNVLGKTGNKLVAAGDLAHRVNDWNQQQKEGKTDYKNDNNADNDGPGKDDASLAADGGKNTPGQTNSHNENPNNNTNNDKSANGKSNNAGNDGIKSSGSHAAGNAISTAGSKVSSAGNKISSAGAVAGGAAAMSSVGGESDSSAPASGGGIDDFTQQTSNALNNTGNAVRGVGNHMQKAGNRFNRATDLYDRAKDSLANRGSRNKTDTVNKGGSSAANTAEKAGNVAKSAGESTKNATETAKSAGKATAKAAQTTGKAAKAGVKAASQAAGKTLAAIMANPMVLVGIGITVGVIILLIFVNSLLPAGMWGPTQDIQRDTNNSALMADTDSETGQNWSDFTSTSEALTAEEESAAKANIQAKVSATKQRLTIRANKLREGIQDEISTSELQGLAENSNPNLNWDWGGYSTVTSSVTPPNNISDADALRILCAYSTMMGTNASDISTDDYLSWIGKKKLLAPKMDPWKGTFLPASLFHEMDAQLEAVSGGKSYATLMLESDSSWTNKDGEDITDKVNAIIDHYEPYQTALANLLLVVEEPEVNTWNNTVMLTTTRTYTDADGNEVTEEVQYPYNYGCASVTYKIKFLDTKEIGSVLGFWSGPLEKDAPYTYVDPRGSEAGSDSNSNTVAGTTSATFSQPGSLLACLHTGNSSYDWCSARDNSRELFEAAGQKGFWAVEGDMYSATQMGHSSPSGVSFDEYLQICKKYNMIAVLDHVSTSYLDSIQASVAANYSKDKVMVQTYDTSTAKVYSDAGFTTSVCYCLSYTPKSPETYKEAGISVINIQKDYADEATIRKYIDGGLKVMIFSWGSFTDDDLLQKYIDLGVSYIMTNTVDSGLTYQKDIKPTGLGRVSGDDVKSTVWNYMVDNRITDNPAVIAGVLGNAKAESGIDPNTEYMFGILSPSSTLSSGVAAATDTNERARVIMDYLTMSFNPNSRYYGRGLSSYGSPDAFETFIDITKQGNTHVTYTSGADGAASYADLYVVTFERCIYNSHFPSRCKPLSDSKVQAYWDNVSPYGTVVPNSLWQDADRRENYAREIFGEMAGSMTSVSTIQNNNIDSLQGKKILVFGDSISAGARLSSVNQTWHGVLASEQGAIIEKDAISGRPLATGTSYGSFVSAVQNHAADRSVDVVVIQGYTNDAVTFRLPIGDDYNSTDTSTMIGAINVITSELNSKFPNALKVFLMCDMSSIYTDLARPYQDAIRTLASKHGYLLVDMVGHLTPANWTDGVHPNAEDHKNMAKSVADAITNTSGFLMNAEYGKTLSESEALDLLQSRFTQYMSSESHSVWRYNYENYTTGTTRFYSTDNATVDTKFTSKDWASLFISGAYLANKGNYDTVAQNACQTLMEGALKENRAGDAVLLLKAIGQAEYNRMPERPQVGASTEVTDADRNTVTSSTTTETATTEYRPDVITDSMRLAKGVDTVNAFIRNTLALEHTTLKVTNRDDLVVAESETAQQESDQDSTDVNPDIVYAYAEIRESTTSSSDIMAVAKALHEKTFVSSSASEEIMKYLKETGDSGSLKSTLLRAGLTGKPDVTVYSLGSIDAKAVYDMVIVDSPSGSYTLMVTAENLASRSTDVEHFGDLSAIVYSGVSGELYTHVDSSLNPNSSSSNSAASLDATKFLDQYKYFYSDKFGFSDTWRDNIKEALKYARDDNGYLKLTWGDANNDGNYDEDGNIKPHGEYYYVRPVAYELQYYKDMVSETAKYADINMTQAAGFTYGGMTVVQIAQRELANNEPGSKYISGGQPWCAAFVTYVFREAGFLDLVGGGSANCYDFLVNSANAGATVYYPGEYTPQPGDVVIFWHGGRVGQTSDGICHEMEHIGIVESYSGGTLTTIEGNCSDMLKRNTGDEMSGWPSGGHIFCYIHPNYPIVLGGSADPETIRQTIIQYLYGGVGGGVSCDFDGYHNVSGRHEGIDFCGNSSAQQLYSILDGEIIYISWSGTTMVNVYDAERDKTVCFMHLNVNRSLSEGQTIHRGDYLGTEGANGRVTGPHTHVEVINGRARYAQLSSDNKLDNDDPYPYYTALFGLGGANIDLGNSNASIIYSYMAGKGLSDYAIAGILGNIQSESGFDPQAYNPNDNGSPSYGLCQWHAGRYTNLKNFAGVYGEPPSIDMNTQLDFLWNELQTSHSSTLSGLQSATSAAEASWVWGNKFEVFAGYDNYNGTAHTTRRNQSETWYNKIIAAKASAAVQYSYTSGLTTGGVGSYMMASNDSGWIKSPDPDYKGTPLKLNDAAKKTILCIVLSENAGDMSKINDPNYTVSTAMQFQAIRDVLMYGPPSYYPYQSYGASTMAQHLADYGMPYYISSGTGTGSAYRDFDAASSSTKQYLEYWYNKVFNEGYSCIQHMVTMDLQPGESYYSTLSSENVFVVSSTLVYNGSGKGYWQSQGRPYNRSMDNPAFDSNGNYLGDNGGRYPANR